MININEEKLKIYLDTSVVSYLQQEDSPEKMAITLKLWKKFKTNVFNVCLSSMTIMEINGCSESKVRYLNDKLDEIKYTQYMIDEKCYDLANEIIKTGILTEKSIEDCQHIACAVINNCDVIVSWNFKHLVNIKTIKGIRKITQLKGYKDIEIVNPSVLLEMEV